MSTRAGIAEEELEEPELPDVPNMADWDYEKQETWYSFPVHQAPVMQHAAHPVNTEVPPGYDGTTGWLNYSDAVEEWCDLTKVEARRRGPVIAARLSDRA